MDTLEAGDPTALTDAVADTFVDLHGRQPFGVFAAPGRVNLIGEHVDYNGGLCLPMALPHTTYAAVAPRDDAPLPGPSRQQDDSFSGRLDALGPGQVTGWATYAAGVLWALQQDGWEPPGMDIVVDSTVPLGAGLSSSAAIECSVALGITELVGRTLDDELRAALVRACMRAESEVAGAPTGGMDQTIALFARAESALLLDCRDWSTTQVGWDPASADLTLMVVDTRASHSLSDGGYESRRRDCETAARTLGVDLLRDVGDTDAALAKLDDERIRRRVRHVFTEIDRVRDAVRQLEDGDFEGLGASFTASHVSLRDDYEVSAPELDAVVDTALEHGALGARMTGGGFGGSALAPAPAGAAEGRGGAGARRLGEAGRGSPPLPTPPPGRGTAQRP